MKLIVLTTFLLVAIFGVPTEQTPVIAALKNGEKVPVDLTVDDGYALMVSAEPLVPQPFFKPSISLYDIKKQLEARKVLENRVCYIRKFSGVVEPKDVHLKMKAMQNSKEIHDVTEDWSIVGPEIKRPIERSKCREETATGNVKLDKQGVTVEAGHKWDNGLSVSGALSHNKDSGLTAKIGVDYEKDGQKVNGGLTHNKDTGISTNLKAGYTWGNGHSVTGGFTHDRHGTSASIGFSIPLRKH